MRLLALFVAVGLAGCGAEDRRPLESPGTVSVPVAVGCVSGPRPSDVTPLQAEFPGQEWAKLTAKQKAALVAAQGLRHQSRAEGLEAATGACR